MKLQVIKIGKPCHKSYDELADIYLKRLTALWPFEESVLRVTSAEKVAKQLISKLSLDPSLKKTQSGYQYVVLDERGQELSSPELARFLETKMSKGSTKQLSFVIGGPYGLPDGMREGSDFVWRLSKGVFPSDLAWVMALEQLYRATTILRGSPYHHE